MGIMADNWRRLLCGEWAYLFPRLSSTGILRQTLALVGASVGNNRTVCCSVDGYSRQPAAADSNLDAAEVRMEEERR